MRIPKIVKRHREACIDMAFKGSYDPATWGEVEKEFSAAEEALVAEIARLRRSERDLRACLKRSIQL